MNRSLRVLILAQYFPPDMGGASTRASNVAKGLLGKGCRVVVVAAFPHYPLGKVPTKYKRKPIIRERVDGLAVLRVWVPALPHNNILNRIILHLCFIASSLFALPFVDGVDVIWAANPNLFSFIPALAYSFAKQKSIVRNVDDLWPEVFYELGLVQSGWKRKMLDCLAWFSYVVPAAITPVSDGYKRRIVEKYGVCAEKIHVIEGGVDQVMPFNINKSDSDQFVIMYSGILGMGYDFDTVLEAASLLMKNEDVVFVIRGVGELASKLQREIKKLNLKNVVLDTTFLSRERLSALLSSADVFMLPLACAGSVDDGLPAKVFEYQSYGKPIICISDGEPARYVKATKSGLVVKPRDAHGFAEAIGRLHKDQKLASTLGWNGYQCASNLTPEKIGERMYVILSSVVLSAHACS